MGNLFDCDAPRWRRVPPAPPIGAWIGAAWRAVATTVRKTAAADGGDGGITMPPWSASEARARLERAGLRTLGVVVAIDYTRSNLRNGGTGRASHSLHTPVGARDGSRNQYERVIDAGARALCTLDAADGTLDVYGYGDTHTRDTSLFPFMPQRALTDADELLARYAEITPHIEMSGPTSYHAVIERARERATPRTPVVLLLVTDSHATRYDETVRAFRDAAECALAIVMVGVGLGRWPPPDYAHESRFRNLHFINFELVAREPDWRERLEACVLGALAEQYEAMLRCGVAESG